MVDNGHGGLGQWLQERCQKKGLSLREAGQKAGLSHSTIRDLINGSYTATPETIRKLAFAFSDGDYAAKALEHKLLVLAGHIRPSAEKEVSEPMARLLDIISDFSEPQLRIMTRFADFLADTGAK